MAYIVLNEDGVELEISKLKDGGYIFGLENIGTDCGYIYFDITKDKIKEIITLAQEAIKE